MFPFTIGVIDSVPGFDPDAQAFIDAAGITNTTQQIAVNNLVLGLKTNSLWDKFFAIYPIVGGSASSHKFNLKNPLDTDAAYRMTFTGGFTHNSSGCLSTNQFSLGNTYLKWSTAASTNFPFISIYCNLGGNGDYDCGVQDVSTNSNLEAIISYVGNNTAYNGMNIPANYLTYNHGGTLGLYGWGQNSVNNRFININGNIVATRAAVTWVKPVLDTVFWNLNVGTLNQGSRRRYAWAALGENLSATDMTNLYTVVQAYQTTLGRQV